MKSLSYEDFEEEVKKAVRGYGAFEQEIMDFLFDSGNLDFIFEVAQNTRQEEI